MTIDGRPIADGLLVACDMSGYGATLAPVVGGLLETWLRTGGRPPLPRDLRHDRVDAAPDQGGMPP